MHIKIGQYHKFISFLLSLSWNTLMLNKDPNTTVKNQFPLLLSEKLKENALVVLSYDARFYNLLLYGLRT